MPRAKMPYWIWITLRWLMWIAFVAVGLAFMSLLLITAAFLLTSCGPMTTSTVNSGGGSLARVYFAPASNPWTWRPVTYDQNAVRVGVDSLNGPALYLHSNGTVNLAGAIFRLYCPPSGPPPYYGPRSVPSVVVNFYAKNAWNGYAVVEGDTIRGATLDAAHDPSRSSMRMIVSYDVHMNTYVTIPLPDSVSTTFPSGEFFAVIRGDSTAEVHATFRVGGPCGPQEVGSWSRLTPLELAP